jgi:hypothetical protein
MLTQGRNVNTEEDMTLIIDVDEEEKVKILRIFIDEKELGKKERTRLIREVR